LSNPESQIERLEMQIEDLSDRVRQSCKLMIVGRVASAAGVLALILFALSSTPLSVAWLMTSIALALGGLVLIGASKSSTDELQQALTKAQIERTSAIDALELKEIEQ
jgi:hypothetical protein